ncbi:MAG: METTL5 family protein [Saccharolobus sp.]
MRGFRLNKREIERTIETYIKPHPNPKYNLEQYLTPPSLVSQIIWHAYLSGHISGKRVCDLGCGTGAFCFAISLLGGYCTCVEIDLESLEIAKKTIGDFNADFVQADATYPIGKFDTIIQNPPFGVVKRGIDLDFLKSSFQMANVIYSIHKSNQKSREIIINLAKMYNFNASIITEKFKLKPYYPWHRKRAHEFLVDVYLFSKE